MHRAAIHPCPFKEGPNLAWLKGSEAVTNIFIVVYSGVFPDSDAAPDAFPLEKGKPLSTDKFAVSDEDSPALCWESFQKLSHQHHAGIGVTVPAVVKFCPGERQDDISDKDAENEQIAGTLAELPIRSVHDKREFPRRKEREQDVQDILLGETSIMEHSRHHPGDGVRCRSAVNVKGNLAVEGGFSLQDAQNDLGNAAQTVGAVMWKTLFEVGGERVNMGEGSLGLFHTPYELPFVVFSAFWTTFFSTCQVLSPNGVSQRKYWDGRRAAHSGAFLGCAE